MQRVDRLTEAPIAGQYYLVPVVRAVWDGHLDHWPVIGPRHTDQQFFNFEHEHYHIDGRFLSKRQRGYAEHGWYSLAAQIQRTPLMTAGNFNRDMPKPVLAKRKCWTPNLPYEHHHETPVKELIRHFAGSKCASGKAGWICPHQKAPLGSVEIIDGIITCPLHGLRINAASGEVLRTVA